MPRQQGTSVVNNFSKGLVTDATALTFPENACTDADNIVFDSTGRITRRLGFDLEPNFVELNYGTVFQDVYTTFVWNSVAGDGNVSFLVSQCGNTLRFYNISAETNISTNIHATSVSLLDFLATGSSENPSFFECQFAAINGDLIVVNPVCDPFFVFYDIGSNSFSSTAITLRNRDFEGVNDGLEDNERPEEDLDTLDTANPNHFYNLYNQGWLTGTDGTDALIQWDTARDDLPSNCDYVGLYRNSVTDPFDDDRVAANTPGNRLAPKGHFIIDSASVDRQAAMDATDVTVILATDSLAVIPRTLGTTIGDFDQSPNDAFNGDFAQTIDAGGPAKRAGTPTSAYIGKNYGLTPQTINRVVITGEDGNRLITSDNDPISIRLYAKNSLPANGTDGTLLGSRSVFDGDADSYSIISNDSVTSYQYVWVYILPAGSVADICLSEVTFYSGSTLTFRRAANVESYAGRVFYGGIEVAGLSNNIYFSQIIEKRDQYGKCYQKNDPTSEDLPDLLPDDGGVIKIPAMGSLMRLFCFQNALLAFANNGIWLVSGSSGATFKADDYVVKKISSIGITSSQSLCSIKGLPAWWGEDGIYTIQFDANYDSFTPVSLTNQTIDRFYQEVPLLNRKFAKGAYDETNQIAYWLFSANPDLGTDVYQYDSVLCLDGKSKAFYTWSISAGPIVRSIDYIKAATRENEALLKLFVNTTFDATVSFHSMQTWAEITNTNFIDWESTNTSVAYESSFTTGYRLDGQTQRFFQPCYVFVFLEQEENASCFMQGRYDFTTVSNEGKWSTRQQIYNENLFNRGVNFRRLKVRGKGRALQMHFESESQKPFTIIGWSIFETTNTGL